jgi:hypothetical protein
VPASRSISCSTAGGLQRRKRQQQQERCDELRPDEEGQPHPRQSRRAQLHDRDDAVDRLPTSDDVISRNMPASQIVWPALAKSASGGYDVHPELGRAGRKKEA